MSLDITLLTEQDLYLFNEGTHYRADEKLGAHPLVSDGVAGTYFAVWAPNARLVSVVGDFNGWKPDTAPMRPRGRSGIWEGFVPEVGSGDRYKYHLVSRVDGYTVDKSDPYAFATEAPPGTASVVYDSDYAWGDSGWMSGRESKNGHASPISTYEVHLGSWMRPPGEGGRFLTYRELAPRLAEHVRRVGFTHVELMPVMEHPFYGSWGYQVTGFFAPTARYGSPNDFRFFIDYLHRQGIGVILDWVPSHFPSDEHSLGYFDGTHLYEHGDPRLGVHPDWGSLIFDYGRNEVRSFLLSSARYWLESYHADGLRLDAVASMLYLDYSRRPGEWVPNRFGGRENLEAIAFLRQLNEMVYREYPGVQTIAEESTAWPMVSRPAYVGGLGFGMKWDMGWMHDTLEYFSLDPIHRAFHHGKLLFRAVYAFAENYILSLSHDEVVHLKGSLLSRMPGDEWRQLANLRLLYAYMFGQPGKKLLFMGGELGQRREWNHDAELDWSLLGDPRHAQILNWLGALNRAYVSEPALHGLDFEPAGFEWVDSNDSVQSVISFLRNGAPRNGAPRNGAPENDVVLVVLNFTPMPRHDYRVGVPRGGRWRELLNSDASEFGGAGIGNFGGAQAESVSFHGRPFSLILSVPPLGAVFLKWDG